MRIKISIVLIIWLGSSITLNGSDYQHKAISSSNPFSEAIAYVDSFQTYPFLIIKDGRTVCERYFRNYIRYDLINSYSMAKSYMSAILGIAIMEDKISLDDRVSDYVKPPLSGEGVNAVTDLKVGHLATMIRKVLNAMNETQSASASEITLPGWISDNMMLPAGIPFNITGMAEPRKMVSVSFGSVSATAISDDSGSWRIEFPSVKAGMRGELVITSNSKNKVISNVVSGDTWLCSGQSNMQRTVARSDASGDAEKDIGALDIRCFDGEFWKRVTAENVQGISAVAVCFAIEMASRQQLPIGIYIAARGGTSIDAWIPGDAFPDTESGRYRKSLINDPEVLKAAEDDLADFRPAGQYRLARWGLSRAVPSSLYKQLIKAFSDFPVRGVVWYQGESNAESVEQAKEYSLWLSNLILEYRKSWGNPKLPFVIIQLPSYDPGTPRGREAWEILQNMQARVAFQTDYAEVVRIKDLGDLKDIHPRQKKEVGVRAADVAWKLSHADKY